MSKKKKTYDKPMKGESAKSFKKYKIYDNLSPEVRSIRKVAEIILENENVSKSDKNYENRLKKLISSLENLSARWFWEERSLMHDADKLLKEAEEHEQEYKEVNGQLISCFKMIINSCENKLIDINEGIPTKEDGSAYSIVTLIKLNYEIAVTLKIANEQIRLCFGLPTDNTKIYHEGKINKHVSVEPTNTLEMIREVDEELADLYEPNTEHSDTS